MAFRRRNRGKNKKEVVTPLNEVLTTTLEKVINHGVQRIERLFPYSIHQIERIWKQIRKKAGLEAAVRIHDLRHTFGSRAGQVA